MNSTRQRMRVGVAAVAAMGILLGLAGCSSNVVKPVSAPYSFLDGDKDLGPSWQRMTVNRRPDLISACITSPEGYTIDFYGSISREIAPGGATVRMGEGLYPFRLIPKEKNAPGLCGAMMVVNVNETVALATFGKAAETKLFSEDFLAKARSGVFASYTITFDGKPIIYYWLGNRCTMCPPDEDTVELDFTGIKDLKEIRVNGSYIERRRTVVTINTSKQVRANPTFRLDMTLTSGKTYTGYIKNFRPNAFTTFTSLPCAIPAALFEAAERGTISKFSVFAETDKENAVAEIVFGQGKS